MSELVAIDYTADNAAELFTESLRETGFGVLKNHPIQKGLAEKMYQDWLAFFLKDDKDNYYFNESTQDGYFPPSISEVAKGHTVKDIKEYYHIYPKGQIPDYLERDAKDYYKEANKLASTLLSWVEKYTPAEVAKNYRMPLRDMIDASEKTLLRVLHYPPMTGREEPGAIRAAAHSDINLLTVLPAATDPGLQVQLKDGKWIDVPCDFGTLIVNIGDMLQEASGGYYPSTIHRVINPSGRQFKNSRISMPLFLHPRPDVVLSDKYTAGSYLRERLIELGVLSA